ncbi:MAG: GyrI-like domain-containing protein [Chitinophagaceae bacterium]|nr:GyrI-like domain-containing protein [Chitinophagaceae bacterium]
MEIKTSPSLKVLYSTHQTSIPKLSQFVGTVVKELYAEAVSANVLISGPPYWIYKGMDGREDTVFTLEIAIPVQGSINSKKFKVKELPPFRSVSHVHEFAWDNLPATYGQIMQYIALNKLGVTNECREVYLNIDFNQPLNNRTEVQMGIKQVIPEAGSSF